MRKYAMKETGGRVLEKIACDFPGCKNSINYTNRVWTTDGWTKRGVIEKGGEDGTGSIEYHYCPTHS